MCGFCKNLDEMEKEYPDGPYHGANIVCDECGAEYYEEYMRDIFYACNEQAQECHPELKTL